MEASAHRANARAALRGNWVTAAIVALLANIISSAGGTRLNIKFNFGSGHFVEFTAPERMQRFLEMLGFALPLILAIAGVMLVVSMIVSGVVELGSARYNLNLIDRRPAEIADLFTGIPRFADALVMHLLKTLLILAGFLLLFVPGVMMTYGFAMTSYILAEDPACSGPEALRRSWDMMNGHKLELFWLELTFIGWELLASLTLGIGNLVLNPYKAAARASFYRDLAQAPFREEDWTF